MKAITVYSDGAARGNPGPAAAGWVIIDPHGKTLCEGKKYLGELTNNQAEYQALLLALTELTTMVTPAECSIQLRLDSELLVHQLNGKYRVKNAGLKPLYLQAKGLLAQFQAAKLNHIPREQNATADGLANEAIDEHFE